MRNKAGGLRLLALVLLMTLFSSAQGERLPLKAYTVVDGLAHNEINKIVRDSRGFLWFCTANGLSRFDGYAFTNFGTDQGLPHANVTDLLETRTGEYWVGTNVGLVRFNPRGVPLNRVTKFGEENKISPMFTVIASDDPDRRAKAVTVLLERRDGAIWCGTYKGLQRLDTSASPALRTVDIGMPNDYPEQLVIRDLLEDKQGSLWVAAPSGLYRRWPDASVARYTVNEGLPNDFLSDLLEDSRGRLWAATLRGGFFQFAADSSHSPPSIVQSYGLKDGLTTDWVFQLFETSDGQLKVATNKGLAEFYSDGPKQGRALRLYTTNNGLSYREINALGEDAGGNLWLGTVSGAMKLAHHGFISYGEDDGLMFVGTIVEDRAGGVCFRAQVLGDEHATVFAGGRLDRITGTTVTPWAQLGRYDGRHFTWFSPRALGTYYGWVADKVMLQARNGEWWFGTDEGVYRFAPTDDLTQIKAARPLALYPMPQVFKLFEDSRGDIWVTTASAPINGLARWERATDTWHDLTGTPGLPSMSTELGISIGEDREGNIWVGFGTGVGRFNKESFRFFGGGSDLPAGRIERIYSDRAGRLWLSSSRSGLIRIDDPGADRPTFVTYTTAQGLSTNQLDVIVEDLRGDLYVGSDRGLDRINPSTGRVKHYSTADGLAPGVIHDALQARDGTLWFGTRQGLSQFTPTLDGATTPPPVLVIGLDVAGSRQNVSAVGETEFRQADLAPNQNQIRIEFVGLSFAPGEVLRYQYKLEGADTDWGQLTEQRSVNYANLAPGAYRFLVRASNSDGALSVTPAMVTFRVLPPVWRRWWFITLAALGVGGVGFAFYRYRVTRIFELANMRTRIATDLHDDIGANLTKISILSEVARQRFGNGGGEADNPLSSIARISRESVASMGDIVWAISPQRDSLLDLVRRMREHAEEVFALGDVSLSFGAPRVEQNMKLGVDLRRDVFLIFKEAVNNAARHGRCKNVKILFSAASSGLSLMVSDDGVGFAPAEEDEGQGLPSMRRRAQMMGGKLHIESGAGRGTTIRLEVPLSRRGRHS